MPADDRDAKFENALAHHLRGGSAVACPDAETLAAYHERSLSLEEMTHWKQHISGCATCQETLALVETTERQLAEDWEKKGIPGLQASLQRPSPARSLAGKSLEVPMEEETSGQEVSAATSGRVEILRRRPPLLRWAVPLGAAAAGVLVWIGIHEQHVLQAPKSTTVQVAQNAPAPAPEQKLNDALRTVQPSMEPDERQAQPEAEGARKRADGPHRESRDMSPSAPTASASNAKDAELAKKDSIGRSADALASKVAPAPPPSPGHVQSQPKPAASLTQSVEVSSGAPVAAAPAPAATDSALTGGVGGAVGRYDSKSAVPEAKEKALNKQQAANDLDTNAMMMKQGVRGQLETAAANPPLIIATPDNRVWWQLGPSGTVELTADGGRNWKSVNTGVSSTFTAGSAPSSKICWIAGKAGTLVVTTDRGAHWKTLTTPITGDLGGVRATDATHASIWDAARMQGFETSDGGATWKQAAP